MDKSISHDWKDESIEEKTLWFRSLSLADRVDLFDYFTDLAFSLNPKIGDAKNAKLPKGRIQVLEKT